MPIQTEQNTTYITGEFTGADSPRMQAILHTQTQKLKYQDLTIDFSHCTKALPEAMVPLCARCQAYWKASIDVALILPSDERLRKLFRNSNWAYLIDHRKHEESRYKGYEQVPLLRFTDHVEQKNAVDRILGVLLAALSEFHRSDLHAIEWAINEISDNVINHSESSVGGFIHITNFRQRKVVEFVVCDVGIGIPASLQRARGEQKRDQEWIDLAIREGVTRDVNVGQGNGLYGTWRITQRSSGELKIASGYSSLVSSASRGLHVTGENIPFAGTMVVAKIGYKEPINLSDALLFRGRSHEPLGFIDQKYEPDESGNVRFLLQEESSGFGSRMAGDPVRRKLANLSRMAPAGRIIIDCRGVPLMSSSYADEVFGKLFIELGPMEFSKNFELTRLDPLVRNLIDRAIFQRMSLHSGVR